MVEVPLKKILSYLPLADLKNLRLTSTLLNQRVVDLSKNIMLTARSPGTLQKILKQPQEHIKRIQLDLGNQSVSIGRSSFNDHKISAEACVTETEYDHYRRRTISK